MREQENEAAGWAERSGLLSGIAQSIEQGGTLPQRLGMAALFFLLMQAALPCGVYALAEAMFAVMIGHGFGVTAAFAGIVGGFALHYAQGSLAGCWQLIGAAGLWLTCGLWARPGGRGRRAAAVVIFQASHAALLGETLKTPYGLLVTLGACAAAGAFSVLYDGAFLCMRHRGEPGESVRPVCMMAAYASLQLGLLGLPLGDGARIAACALAVYLTLEHAHSGGARQSILCGGVLGGVAAWGAGAVHPAAMLLVGGFLSGELRTGYRLVTALLMLSGMTAGCALLGGDALAFGILLWCLPGFLPFLLLPATRRMAVTALIAREEPETPTQSEAVAVRCATMIHAWARMYEDTAKMMEGLAAPEEVSPVVKECIALLRKTSACGHQVCERTLDDIRPDDAGFTRLHAVLEERGMEDVRVSYCLRVFSRVEVMLEKPEHVAGVSLLPLVEKGCGRPMRMSRREGLLPTQALYEQAPLLTIQIAAATRSRTGEEVAGDAVISRALPGGRHVLALSDGMGSGVAASTQSHAALGLLAEALRAGYTRAQALDMVNALMLMCTGREMYATMDLMTVDLHSGEAAFEKLGACPSYVVRDGEVRTIGADTLPVGMLEAVEASSQKMTLEPGDVVVLLTDGVSYPGGEEGLMRALSRLAWLHPQAIAEKLMERVLEDGEAKDDMALVCAKIVKDVYE